MADSAYSPDYAIPPGDSLQATLDALGMGQAELAQRTGRTPKHVNEVAKGKAAITPEFALQLERVLGVPASFWNNRERRYREALALEQEGEALQDQTDWLKTIPVGELRKRGYVRATRDRVQILRDVLSFFGVSGPEQWEATWRAVRAQFRQSSAFDVSAGALATWLRIGELEAAKVPCASHDADVFRSSLKDCRNLTTQLPEKFIPELREICKKAGVALVAVREIRGAPISGATRWLAPDKALIQLSLRYKSDDQFWFSFFHEAGHVVLHGKRRIFIDRDTRSTGPEEREADEFAADMLVPPKAYDLFCPGGQHISHKDVEAFARRLRIAPGIVVGRLQYDGRLPHTHLNKLKLRYEWAKTAYVA